MLSSNERRLIELIFRKQGIARTELAQAAGMTGSRVTRLVTRLIDDGLVEEGATRDGSRGQPRRPLSLRAGRCFSAGVNFSRRWLDLTLLDIAAVVVGSERLPLPGTDPGAIAETIQRGLRSLLQSHGLRLADLIGFGVSVPGNFGMGPNEFRAHAYFPEIDGARFAAELERLLGRPTSYENDGTCAVLAEFMFGAGSGARTLFLIHVGHGVGGGAIVDGQLFRGANGNAGLPGALYPMESRRPSGQDLMEFLVGEGHAVHDFADLEVCDGRLRRDVERWIAVAAVQLRLAVRVVSGLFDPEVIVLGGRLPQWMNAALVAGIDAPRLAGPSRNLSVAPLVASRRGPAMGALGAACVPLFAQFFSRSSVQHDTGRSDFRAG